MTQTTPILSALWQGAYEILGLERMQQLFGVGQLGQPVGEHSASDFDSARLSAVLQMRFGALAAQGLGQRIGQAAFHYWLRRNGKSLGLTASAFRLQRAPQRMAQGLSLLAEQFNSGRSSITLENVATHWIWRDAHCPACAQQPALALRCDWMVGFLRAFFGWAGGGRAYRVVEKECRAAGAYACAFWIDQKPLD